jgi:hypothetical protein
MGAHQRELKTGSMQRNAEMGLNVVVTAQCQASEGDALKKVMKEEDEGGHDSSG